MGMLALLRLTSLITNFAGIKATCDFSPCGPALNLKPFSASTNIFNSMNTAQKPKQKDCRPYIAVYTDGKYLWDNCIKKKVCEVAESCDAPKPAELQLILTYFHVLQQFIFVEVKKYDKALKECDLLTMFLIARYQFEIMFSEPYLAVRKCKAELSKSFTGCIKIVSRGNIVSIEHEKFYPCVIPRFLLDPQDFFLVPREVDIELFEIIELQIKKMRNINIDINTFDKMKNLFIIITQQYTERVAIIRIKIFLLILATDLRTNRLDCTLNKYISIIKVDNNSFCYPIDPVCKYLFGFKCT